MREQRRIPTYSGGRVAKKNTQNKTHLAALDVSVCGLSVVVTSWRQAKQDAEMTRDVLTGGWGLPSTRALAVRDRAAVVGPLACCS